MIPILRRTFLYGGLALVTTSSASRSAMSASGAQLWQKWAATDPNSRVIVDHQAWGNFLRRYLLEEPDGINRLRYSEVSAVDRQALGRYVEDMSKVAVHALKPAEQFAYWINLYNALTVKTVLDHYPEASIREISVGGSFLPSFLTGGGGPWQAKLIQIEGKAVALDDIEHRILRPLLKDNRVHYVVNCASIGCPSLMAAPFTATNLQSMLDRAASGLKPADLRSHRYTVGTRKISAATGRAFSPIFADTPIQPQRNCSQASRPFPRTLTTGS
jgi:hypothetical protein